MNTRTIKGKSLGILLSLALVLSLVAVAVPAKPVMASADSITILFPSSSNITYAKTGGWVDVGYTVTGSGTTDIGILVNSATLGTAGNSGTLTKTAPVFPGVTYQTPVLITGSTEGTYNVQISCSENATAGTTNTNAVVIDNTAPVVSISIPSSTTCWMGGSTQNIQWAATDAAGPANVTIYVDLDIGAQTYPYSIINGVSYTQGAQIFGYAFPAITSATCKVRIKAIDSAGNDSGWIYSSLFSILNTAPGVAVVSPNGGEVWNGGSSQTITGTITGTGTSVYYQIGLSVNGTNTDNITSSWQSATLTGGVYNLSYPWTVLNTVRSSLCKIIVWSKDCAGNTGSDQSNADFRIKDVTAPTVTVTAPTTGTTWYAGSAQNITWNQTDNVPSVNLLYEVYYTPDGGTNWYMITSGTSAQGANTYSWPIPAGLASGSNYKIKVVAKDQESPLNTGTGYSGTFTITSDITSPTITVCTPNGSESWEVGTIHSITWTCSDSPDANARMRYLIELSTDGGGTYPVIVADLSNQTQCSSCSCSYSWAVSDNPSTTAKIRITAFDPAGNSASDASDNVFTIVATTCAVETANITLTQNWNLISLPIWPTNTDINSLMAGIMSNIVSVWYYNNGTWYSWAPGAPSTLTTLEGGKAYWVNMATGGPYTLTFQGRKCPCPPASPTTFSVSTTGWNMIGFKSTIGKSVSNYFSSLGTCGTAYLAPINGYTGGAWTTVNCSDNMTPGLGYWVYINSTGSVNPGCE